MILKKQAFTLVELIVVITILAILGTIAFLSLSGYSKDSRNSVRFNDLKLIESSLELYSQKTGFYPESTLPVTITFANAEAWTQGTFGEDTFGSVGKLDHLPLDPLTGTEYTYSLLNTKGEYELAAALEGIVASNDTKLINKTYAGTLEGTSLVLGTYNGNMLKVSTGGLDYVLAVPTIISGDITLLSVDEIMFYNKLAYNGSRVLAGSYKNTEFDTNKAFDYGFTSATGGLIIFTGSVDDLKFSQYKRMKLVSNLQKAYSGTVLENDTDFSIIIDTSIDVANPGKLANDLSVDKINNSLGFNIKKKDPESYWIKSSGGIGRNGGYYMISDNDDNIYATGDFCGNTDIFGELFTDTGLCDAFLVKLDSEGNLLWAKKAGGDGYDYGWELSLDDFGNIFVGGTFKGTSVILFGESIINIGGLGNLFVSKLDKDGNLIWNRTVIGAGSWIENDSSGNIYVEGYYKGTNVDVFGELLTSVGIESNTYLAKLDKDGNKIWVKNVYENGLGGKVKVNKDGNIFVAGSYKGTNTNVLGQILTNSGTREDAFVAKLDINGNLLWINDIKSSNYSTIWAMETDGYGNIYLQGDFKGINVNIFGGVETSTSGDIFFVKLNSDGNLLWLNKTTGAGYNYSSYNIPIDRDGNIYSAGNFTGIANIYGQNLISKGDYDMVLSKFDKNGNNIWVKQFGGLGWDWITSLGIDSNDNINIFGTFYGTADILGKDVTSIGDGDLFIGKLDKDGNLY